MNAENEARRAASLRRIAIVLQDLPDAVASRLLADLGPQLRTRVRHELRNLVDVDPVERKRAIESFTGSLKQHAAGHNAGSDDGRESRFRNRANIDSLVEDELNLTSGSANPPESPRWRNTASAQPASPRHTLEFLDQLDDDDLYALLGDEHPQTKAVVFAAIEPSRAARLLPRLRHGERQEMLSRIGRLQALPDDMLADLATSFRSRVERIAADKQRNPLQQLLDENATSSGNVRVDPAAHVPRSAAAVSPRLQAILAEMPSTREEPATAIADRLRRVAGDKREAESTATNEAVNRSRNQATTRERPSSRQSLISSEESALSTDEIHRALTRLPAKKLCEALGLVETRVAILALCGLPNQIADAAIGCLPRAQANQVRQHLMAIGSMEIRDIDRAKEQIARAASVAGSTNRGLRQAVA